jgi:hypothetical protein
VQLAKDWQAYLAAPGDRVDSAREPVPDAVSFIYGVDDPPKNIHAVRSRAWKWKRRATDEQVHEAAHALIDETDPDRVVGLCNVFRYDEFPIEIAPLIDKAKASASREERYWLLDVLHRSEDERVRQLALDLVRRYGPDADILELFILNQQPGDAAIILNAIQNRTPDEFESDFGDIHAVAMAIARIYEDGSDPQGWGVLHWAYEATPCSSCRFDLFKGLLRTCNAPDWLIQENLHDCDPDTRACAANALAGEPFDDDR